MSKRIAVVTGGIGGLGTAICISLASAGRTVVAVDLPSREERLQAFQREVEGLDIRFAAADVGDHAACAGLVRSIEADLGSLDILVNNAGITRDSTLRKMARQQWDDVLDVNLGSAFNLCSSALEGMLARGFGRIVNISSVSGQTGNFGQGNYAAAKAGLHGLTMSLAREVASKGITVNSISPGYIETAMTAAMPQPVLEKIVASIPAGRMGRPEDIARTVVFLSDEAAGYLTGANLPVNGGLFMSF